MTVVLFELDRRLFADGVVNPGRVVPVDPAGGLSFRPGPPGIENLDFRIINIAADGPVVMTERVDVFKLPGKSFELPVMGTFEVTDGKISAWRDYFDMNQVTSRMG